MSLDQTRRLPLADEARVDAYPLVDNSDAVIASLEEQPAEHIPLHLQPEPFPAVGETFLGFELLDELGQGAFGRVFLARQGELADRCVALKVSAHMGEETQALAQLQHTNIVPIYSVHRCGPWQAVCMPYLGSTTLADLLHDFQNRHSLPTSGKGLISTLHECRGSTRRPGPDGAPVQPTLPAAARPPADLQRLQEGSYVEAVLWLGARLADGLAHAHERGILHRDLKPANILMSDEGQPLLLDFNLSDDLKRPSAAARAQLGGTLSYMAPEHLEAFQGGKRAVDARSDLYSLGRVLFEMLAGRTACDRPSGTAAEVISVLLEDRRQPPPGLRRSNPAVTPATEAIILRCLEPEPARRYQSARELQEDLERQLAGRPLRHVPEPSLAERFAKFRRRHPRLTSGVSVGIVAALLLAGLAAAFVVHRNETIREQEVLRQRQDRQDALAARERFARLRDDVRFRLTRVADQDNPTEALARGREALSVFGALEDGWQESAPFRDLPDGVRDQVRAEVGELLCLLADAILQGAVSDGNAEAMTLNDRAAGCFDEGNAPHAFWAQRADLAGRLGRDEEAKCCRATAEKTPPGSARDHFLLASATAARGRFREALEAGRRATEADAEDFWAWLLCGRCHQGLEQHAQAAACYSRCIALRPELPWPLFNRGLASLRLLDFRQAKADFDRALQLRPGWADAHFNRALALNALGQPREAVADLSRALDCGNPPTRIYFLRARCREAIQDSDGAARDRAEGLKRTPSDEASWVARGLARLPDDPRGALADFDHALEVNPRSLPALHGKAHALSEKLDRLAEAVAVLDRAVELYPDHLGTRGDRGVLLARLGKRESAHRDARECQARGGEGRVLYQAACIYALTSRQEPGDRKEALRLLGIAMRPRGVALQYLESDHDLDSLREAAEFRRLLDAARVLTDTPPR